MSRAAEFAKTCIVGGVLGVLPIAVAVILVVEIIDGIGALVAPITDLLAVDELVGIEIATIVAVLLILVACFAIGLILRTRFGAWIVQLLERSVFDHVPGYSLVKNVSRRFAGADEGMLFAPALADLYGNDARALGFIVEELRDGRLTLLIPNAPTPTVGTLYILPASRVERLQVPVADAVNAIMQWGVGSGRLVE